MAGKSKIEWTDASWNPIVGCSKVSAGCANCYAIGQAHRMASNPKTPQYHGLTQITNGRPNWSGKLRLVESALDLPLRWKKPKKIFVNSMSDLFHEAVPDEWIDRIFLVMMICQSHTFQVLTKRAQRMHDYCASEATKERMFILASALANIPGVAFHAQGYADGLPGIRLPNVWLVVSVEDQKTADERIALLLQTPAAVRGVSYEPALGPLTFRWASWQEFSKLPGGITNELDGLRKLDWVVCGGESGPGARPMHPDWARSARDQCVAAGVPFFFKQWGEWVPDSPGRPYLRKGRVADFNGGPQVERVGKKAAGRVLDGREWNEFPNADTRR